MSLPGRYVTIVVHEDGALASRTLRISRWAYRTVIGAAISVGVLILLALALYLPIAAAAGRVPGLVREVDRLETENRRIGDLVAALDSAEKRYDRIRAMLGADLVPDPVQSASTLPVAPVVHARLAGVPSGLEVGPSEPTHWPLDDPGYVTRGHLSPGGSGSQESETHPGIDIAVPIGSPVRAAGGGTVLQTGEDSEYGVFALVEHPGGYQTMYGHMGRVTVAPGQPVGAGQVLGLSGNSGHSSAPHLHFEIRRGGESIDPRSMVKEQN